MSIGNKTLSLIDELNRTLGPRVTTEHADSLWNLVMMLEAALISDPRYSNSERELLGRIKAGASFVIEACRDGLEPPSALLQIPLATLQAHVRGRTMDEGGSPPA